MHITSDKLSTVLNMCCGRLVGLLALVCIVKAALVSAIMCTLDGVQSLLLLSHILK